MRALWEALWTDLDYPAPSPSALIGWLAAVFVVSLTILAWLGLWIP